MGSSIPGQTFLGMEDEEIFDNILETLSKISTEEGLDATLVAEKYLNGCLETLETAENFQLRDYASCEEEINNFLSGDEEYIRHSKILNFIIKLIDHPSVQTREILISVFSAFLTEKRHSNYLTLAYLLCHLAHGAISQFHSFVEMNQRINGNSILVPIILEGSEKCIISDHDRIFSSVILYIEKHNNSKLLSSIKMLIDQYLCFVSSKNYSLNTTSDINFQPKYLFEYIFTMLLICPDLLKVNLFTMSLSEANLDKILEFERTTSGSEIKLSENGKLVNIKVNDVYINLLSSLATTCLHNTKGYTNFFILMEHICNLSNLNESFCIVTAKKICQSFQNIFFDKVLLELFNLYKDHNTPHINAININNNLPQIQSHDNFSLLQDSKFRLYTLSNLSRKFTPVKYLDSIYNNMDDIFNSFTYIPKPIVQYNPVNILSLLFLIGYYKNQTSVAQNILFQLVSTSFPHKNTLTTCLSFLFKSFSHYYPNVIKNTFVELLSVNYTTLSIKKAAVLVNNIRYIISQFSLIFENLNVTPLVNIVLQKLPYLLFQAKANIHTKLAYSLIELCIESVKIVNKYCVDLPDLYVSVELTELIILTIKNIKSSTFNTTDDNILPIVVDLACEACKNVADLTLTLDKLIEILWSGSTSGTCSAKKELLENIRNQSNINKQLHYSLFEEITGIKKSDYISLLGTNTILPDNSNANITKSPIETNISKKNKNVSYLQLILSDTDDEEPLEENTIKYIVKLICRLSQVTPTAYKTCHELFLDKFSPYIQNISDAKFSANLKANLCLSQRCSSVWYIFLKRKHLWDLIVAFSILNGIEFLLKAAPLFIPLIKAISYHWSNNKFTSPRDCDDELSLTTEMIRLLQTAAPHPLNKLSLIIESLEEVQYIPVLSQALLPVFEAIFYDLDQKKLPQSENIDSWDKIVSNVRSLAIKNLNFIKDNILFFL